MVEWGEKRLLVLVVVGSKQISASLAVGAFQVRVAALFDEQIGYIFVSTCTGNHVRGETK